MPKDQSGGVRGYHVFSQAFYAKHGDHTRAPNFIDHVSIGVYHPDDGGGTSGEFKIEWAKLSGSPAAQLQVFDDAWTTLPLFRNVLKRLSHLMSSLNPHDPHATPFGPPHVAPTVAQVVAILAECGLRDLTKRESPRERVTRLGLAPPATHSAAAKN